MPQFRVTFGDALLGAHRALLDNLQALEAARAAPPGQLAARLESTREILAEHFRFEEENGYLAQVLERHPHLERAVEHLKQEHRELLETLDGLRAETDAAGLLSDPLRDRVSEWIKRVRRHERSENVLVEDAFNVDLSAED
jgi:hypothetical protein